MSLDAFTRPPRRRQPWFKRHARLIATTVGLIAAAVGAIWLLQPPKPSVEFDNPRSTVTVKVGDVFALLVNATAENAQYWNPDRSAIGSPEEPPAFDDPYLKPISQDCDYKRGACIFVYKALAPGRRLVVFRWAGYATKIQPPDPDIYPYRVVVSD